jgi:co-chaperonin GroES (HSP10)
LTNQNIFLTSPKIKTENMIESGRILPGKVLVKEIPPVEKVGSIFVPNVTKATTVVGEVVIVSKPLPNLDPEITIGDRILHGPHSYVNVEIEGNPYRLVNVQDILYIYK